MNFLDLVFPKRCLGCGRLGGYICRGCSPKIVFIKEPFCSECELRAEGGKTHPECQTKQSLDGLVVVCRYKGLVRSAIQKIKYKWSFDISKVLVDLLTQNLWRFNFPKKAILVPIPLHPKRKKWRGFNQAEILAQELSKRLGQPTLNLIERTRESRTQVGLSKKERNLNVANVFSLGGSLSNFDVRGRDFILVDDVFTSGATMRAVCGVLKRRGARSVWGMAIASG